MKKVLWTCILGTVLASGCGNSNTSSNLQTTPDLDSRYTVYRTETDRGILASFTPGPESYKLWEALSGLAASEPRGDLIVKKFETIDKVLTIDCSSAFAISCQIFLRIKGVTEDLPTRISTLRDSYRAELSFVEPMGSPLTDADRLWAALSEDLRSEGGKRFESTDKSVAISCQPGRKTHCQVEIQKPETTL